MTLLSDRLVEPASEDPEVLFREARRRRRRRMVAYAAALAVIIGLFSATIFTLGSRQNRSPSAARPAAPPRAVVRPEVSPKVAWVDYFGQLHIGDLANLSQRVVAHAGADPTTSLVTAGGRIFWTRAPSPVNGADLGTVVSFDPATGHIQNIAEGSQVFASLDRSSVYVLSSNGQLLAQYTPAGKPLHRPLRLPHGWFLSDAYLLGDPSPVVAGGILVMSEPHQLGTQPSTLAIWNPSSGAVRPMGKVWKVIATYTPPRRSSSVIAWAPASCELTSNCALRLSDSSGSSSRLVRSPLGEGFDWGGAFSPDGRQLAVFAEANAGVNGPVTQLGLVDVATGSVRPVPDVAVSVGDSLAWAQWLPGGERLIAGAVGSPPGAPYAANHFLVDAATGHASSLGFIKDQNLDVNFSVAVLP